MDSTEEKFCPSCGKTKDVGSFTGNKRACNNCQKMRLCEKCRKRYRRHRFDLDPESDDGRSRMCRGCATPKVCEKCLEELPGWMFGVVVNQPDGRYPICFNCAKPKVKRCLTCNLEKSFGHFRSDPEQHDGKAADCRFCEGDLEIRTEMDGVWQQQRNVALATRDQERDASPSPNATRINTSLPKPDSLRATLGLTARDVRDLRDRMASLQGNRCRICELPFCKESPPALDHSHRTHQIRAVLCRRCNMMLGYARDNPELLQRGAAYLADYDSKDQEDS